MLNQENFNGLLISKRKFNRITIKGLPICSDILGDVSTLLDTHGPYIQSIKIESITNVRIKAHKWLEMFIKVPYLEILNMNIENLTITDWPACLILQHLREIVLDLKNCDIKPFFFNYLKPNSLDGLQVTSHWNDLDEFIEKQLSISKLLIPGSNLTQTFPRLRLESFMLFVPVKRKNSFRNVPNENFVAFLTAHPELKGVLTLEWTKTGMNGFSVLRADVVKAICNLPAQEHLILAIDQKFNNASALEFAKCPATKVHLYNTKANIQAATDEILKMKNIQKLTIDEMNLNPDRNICQTLQHLTVGHGFGCNLNQTLFCLNQLQFLEWVTYQDEAKLIYNDEMIAYPHLKSFQSHLLEYGHMQCNK
jgi:hypothetical protein